ncbi:MAG: PhoH family protein [Aeromicrobium erythreum]
MALDLLLDPRDRDRVARRPGRAPASRRSRSARASRPSWSAASRRRSWSSGRSTAVGGQELGYLPGSETREDGAPGRRPCSTRSERSRRTTSSRRSSTAGCSRVLPLTHIRGRSLHDAYVIVDEAQSLERNVLLTVLSRIGANSKVVLTHDVAQRDNLRVGRHDGVVAVVEKLKGHPLFAHVTLTRSERSPVAALVTEMLEDVTL